MPGNAHLLLHPTLSVWALPWGHQPRLRLALRAVLWLVRDPPNPGLNLNPSEVSEVIAWAKNKNAAGEGPSTNTAEAFQWPQHGAGALSSSLWPPCVQRESGGAQTEPLSLSLMGLTSSAFQNGKLSAAGNSCFFAVMFEKQALFPCTCLVLLVCSRLVFLVLIPLVRTSRLSGLLAIYC